MIKKFSNIPITIKKQFSKNLSRNEQSICIRIYEGNDKYMINNSKIGELIIININKEGSINYEV